MAFFGAAAVLVLAIAVAAFIPARRATRIDRTHALKSDLSSDELYAAIRRSARQLTTNPLDHDTHELSFIRVAFFRFDRKLSARTVVLVLAAFACLLYAIWYRTVPRGSVATQVDRDTMCLIYRMGLGSLCR